MQGGAQVQRTRTNVGDRLGRRCNPWHFGLPIWVEGRLAGSFAPARHGVQGSRGGAGPVRAKPWACSAHGSLLVAVAPAIGYYPRS